MDREKWESNVPACLRELPQWVCWRIENRMGKDTKIPYNAKTQTKASSTDPATWQSVDVAWKAVDRFDGLGFVFAKNGPYAGIDLDDCIVDGAVEPWAQSIIDRMGSYTEISPSGKGVKIFVRGSLPASSTRRRKGPIEMYDDGRYFTVTGNHLPNTNIDVQDVNGELKALHAEIFEPAPPPPPVFRTTQVTSNVEDLDLIERAKDAENGYKFLKLWNGDASDYPGKGGDPDHSAADQALCNMLAFWCGPDTDRIDRLFRQSGLVREKWVKRADYRGSTIARALEGRTEFYEPHPIVEVLPDIDESIRNLLGNIEAKIKPIEHKADPFPNDLLDPPGAIGMLCRWINDTSMKYQPILTLGNALAFWGAVIGRKVATPRDGRTNFYCLGVGDSGCGKDHSRKQIKSLCRLAGLTSHLLGGEELSSDAAIISRVHSNPSVLFQLDEIGHLIRSTTSKYSAVHLKNIPPTLTKLFSSSNTVFIGKEYAHAKPGDRKDIEQPNVCLYGTTVPERLYEGLSLDEISDGFLGRMLVFCSDDPDPVERDIHNVDPPDDLINIIQKWVARKDLPKSKGNVAAAVEHHPIVVPFDADALAEINRFRVRCKKYKAESTNGMNALWVRATEHASKIALAIACGNSFDTPKVDGQTMAWAIKLTEYLIKSFADQIKDSVSSSDFERDYLLVYKMVKKSGPSGISHTSLFDKTRRLDPKRRADVIQVLTSYGKIQLREKKGARGPSGKSYIVLETTVETTVALDESSKP